MAPKPNPDLDERVHIPLDPELAIQALLQVDPDSEPVQDSPRHRCPTCRGRGELPGIRKTEGKGMGSVAGPCPDCAGVGYVAD